MNLSKNICNFMVEQGGKLSKSILCSKPQKITNFKGIKYQPTLAKDTVEITNNAFKEIKANADAIFQKVRTACDAEYIEKNFPDVVENVAKGNIKYQNDLNYLNYKRLESIYKNNPELFVLLCKEKGSILDLRTMISSYGDTICQIAKETPIEEIKQTFAEMDKLGTKYNFKPKFKHYINMVVIKNYNPKIYKYINNTNDRGALSQILSWGNNWQTAPSITMIKNITPEQMKVMCTDGLPIMKGLAEYIDNSDTFVKNKHAVQELSEGLSKCKLSTDVLLYRGDKSVGMFDSVNIDNKLQNQVKQLLDANKDKARQMRITPYDGLYYYGPSTNLYDFLMSKESLTLADAMQVAKFGDEKFINEVINRIQDSKVIDKRFKSFSFDKGMASSWRGIHSGDNTTIVHNATIKKGTEGGYNNTTDNAQYEVILNNTPKEMSFNRATYNKQNDTFELDTIIQNV